MKPARFTGLRPAGLYRESPAAPFEIRCICGNILSGQRSAQGQVITCPKCRAERFVLPRSPLPSVESRSAPAAQPPSHPWKWWRWPALAMIVTLVVAGIVLVAAFNSGNHPAGTSPLRLTKEERREQHRQRGLAELRAGSYELAANELQQALDLGANGQVKREHEQTAIMADLLSESLGEIIRNSVGLPEDEWRSVFQKRYAGKAVMLDDVLYRDAQGRFHHQLQIQVLGSPALIELDRLRLMIAIREQYQQSLRMLFGFRLAAIERDKNGTWRILPEPDSGVLFTDPEFLNGLSIPIDAELRVVLSRQKAMAANLP